MVTYGRDVHQLLLLHNFVDKRRTAGRLENSGICQVKWSGRVTVRGTDLGEYLGD